ncbi:segregation/condensation protein A [Halobacteriales archaeon QS_1_68_20]|nr:MAG: segregation/condensation protein A [Halobacteriales archaeon QS_1_68_20]
MTEEREASDAPDRSSGEKRSDEPRDDVPLDITGHEERDDPGERGADDGPADGANALTDADVDDSGDEAPDDQVAGTDGEESADGGGPDREEILGDLAPAEAPEDDEVQPVELLVNLAEEGEIDPWDIDVVRVTDKFLDALDDADLRTSGRALFYACVLLRMKGDALLTDEDEEPEAEPEPWEVDDQLPAGDPVDALESEMDRRLERKRVRGNPETLEELVKELRDVERRMWWKEARTYDTSDSPSGFGRGTQELDYRVDDAGRAGGEPTEAEVTSNTHDEDIETVIEEVHAALRERYEKGREEVLYAEIESAGGSRVMTYLALLFLAHRGHVHLRQDEFFGDLWIRDTSVSSVTGEALAD